MPGTPSDAASKSKRSVGMSPSRFRPRSDIYKQKRRDGQHPPRRAKTPNKRRIAMTLPEVTEVAKTWTAGARALKSVRAGRPLEISGRGRNGYEQLPAAYGVGAASDRARHHPSQSLYEFRRVDLAVPVREQRL